MSANNPPTNLTTHRELRKADRPPSFTLIPAGNVEMLGPDGWVYLVPKYYLRDKDGNLAGFKTEQGDVLSTLSGDPIPVRRHSGLVVPQGPQTPQQPGVKLVKS